MLRLPSSSIHISRSTRPTSSLLALPSLSSASSLRSFTSRASTPSSRPRSRPSSPPPSSNYGLQTSSSSSSSRPSFSSSRHDGPPPPRLWKPRQEITFSHGFIQKTFTPSPARQPPKQAPYGPGSGTASDPKIYLAIEEAQRRIQTALPSPPPSRPALSAPPPVAFTDRQPPKDYQSEPIDTPGFRPATSFTSGGSLRESSRTATLPGTLRHAAKIARSEGPVVRGSVEGEELPPAEFVNDQQKRRAYLPTAAQPVTYGLANQDPSSSSHTRFQRRSSHDGDENRKDSNSVWGAEGALDDAENSAWNETASLRNSDISVSVDGFSASDLDPETLASLNTRKNDPPPFFPSPQPYSSGFNFAPIPGDVIPSSVVPANRIVPNFDPLSWAKLPEPAEVQQVAPLVSPKAVELPKIALSEWRGDEEARVKGSRQTAANLPFVSKKRKGDPTPVPRKLKEIPHPSITLGSSSSSNLVGSPFPSSSSSNTPAQTFDPNDPYNRYPEVSSDEPSSFSAAPYVSADPLLQPWSYDAPLPPSQTPPPPPAPPRIIYPGAPRNNSVTLPAWSLRKAAHLKQAAILNGDGTTHWKPTYKVSREKMNEMRALAKQDPQKYNMRTLSEGFGLNPEAVRRILKSKWQEKDDWEWDVDGAELEEGGSSKEGNSLAEDLLTMAMNGEAGFEMGLNGGGKEDRRRGGRNKLSEDDPFGDIDEVDESGWFMAGGKEFEADAEATAIKLEKKMFGGEEAGPFSAKRQPTTVRRKRLLTKPGNTPFGRSSAPPTPTPSEASTTPPPFVSSPPRPRHDARVNNLSPWIVNSPSSPSSSSSPASPTSTTTPPSSSKPTLLQTVPTSSTLPSPDARQVFETKAAAARSTVERARRILSERRAAKSNELRVFAPPPSAIPSSSSFSDPTTLWNRASPPHADSVSVVGRDRPSYSSSSSRVKSSSGSGDFGFGGGRGERPKPRWEKRENAGGAWGSSTPKSGKGKGEDKPKRDVDSLFG